MISLILFLAMAPQNPGPSVTAIAAGSSAKVVVNAFRAQPNNQFIAQGSNGFVAK